MLESLGAGTRLGYCTNVHAGHDLHATLRNLERHAAGVRRRVDADVLGVGLWLSADAARAARESGAGVRDRLRELGLRVFTLNGFPYADFHQQVVKHRVYEPSWSDRRRLEYTIDLVGVLHDLLEPGEEGSISTLPIGWPGPECEEVDMAAACVNLVELAGELEQLEEHTGRLIHLDLEPEPGCILQRAADVVRLWGELLRVAGSAGEKQVRRYLRVCHDVCHAAVMFEEQQEVISAYHRAGIAVGKVQVSSCVRLGPGADRADALEQLKRFDEPRYLHQTSVRRDAAVTTYPDLPDALRRETWHHDHEWRVHFHVPVHLETIGPLGTSQRDIPLAIELALAAGVKHFEVETYAWTVLPEGLRPRELADGIAEELLWVMELKRP